MYICLDCGAEFDEPKYVEELIGEYWGQPAYYEFKCCPCCGSWGIEEKDK